MKQDERLQEGWVKFTRIYCKEGHIDHWMGDQADHPSNPVSSQIKLNAFSTLYRFDNGKWIFARDIRCIQDLLAQGMNQEFTAQEIWEEAVRIEAIRCGIVREELLEIISKGRE